LKDRVLGIGEAGLEAAEERVQNLMSDMVNSKTPGYRKAEVVTRAFPLELEAAERKISARFGAMKPKVEGKYYNSEMGSLVRTGKELDLAIGGDGFFVLMTPFGEAYTRDGRFYVDTSGQMVSVSGNHPLLAKHGSVVVPPGSSSVVVSPVGEVKANDQVVGQMRIVKPEYIQALETSNGTLFRDPQGRAGIEEMDSPRIIQGYLESSNVNVIDSMMEVILVNRLYNINTKLIQTRDAGLGRALELGRPSQ